MHGNIPIMFDLWADPVVNLLLLKSSTLFQLCNSMLIKNTDLIMCLVLTKRANKSALFQSRVVAPKIPKLYVFAIPMTSYLPTYLR